jgi:hypothetical protein
METHPTQYRLPLATLFAILALTAAPSGLRAELLVGAPAGEPAAPGARAWAPSANQARRSRREDGDEDEAPPTPTLRAAQPLLALALALAIPPTFAASEVVSGSGNTPKVDKVPDVGGNSGGPPTITPSGGPPPDTQTTPEPASLITGLIGAGVAGAVALARRRRAARRAAPAA